MADFLYALASGAGLWAFTHDFRDPIDLTPFTRPGKLFPTGSTSFSPVSASTARFRHDPLDGGSSVQRRMPPDRSESSPASRSRHLQAKIIQGAAALMCETLSVI